MTISRAPRITWLSFAVISLVVTHDTNAGITEDTAYTGALLNHINQCCLYGITAIWHHYEVFLNRPFVHCGDLKECKSWAVWRKRGGASWQYCENLERKQTLYVCSIILGGHSHPFQTSIKLWTRPTACSGLPPDSLVIGPVPGPEYLFSDAERAITGQLKLGKVYAVPL